ncbi:hypothetical protein MuYL_4002 [Mucilaginibacter xinganensis]|uniref:Uncharacterized protein n=1 Tax=Mucilaginibacter xinganensis TaxID=1234841 RepID=A0A223P1C3_9SPHI|nr:hypothetical protein MuYL_4002 [Mucilaginibacter xinganensis]
MMQWSVVVSVVFMIKKRVKKKPSGLGGLDVMICEITYDQVTLRRLTRRRIITIMLIAAKEAAASVLMTIDFVLPMGCRQGMILN